MTQVNIPSEKKGERRIIELDLISNMPALRLVGERHVEDAHPNLESFAFKPDCQICAEISKRAYEIDRDSECVSLK